MAEALGVSQQWVTKYDPEPVQPNKPHKTKIPRRGIFEELEVDDDSESESKFKIDESVRKAMPIYE